MCKYEKAQGTVLTFALANEISEIHRRNQSEQNITPLIWTVPAQPWACNVDFPARHLTFGSWQELGTEIHVTFFTFEKQEPSPEPLAIRAGLRFGVSFADATYLHPEVGDYGGGLAAYDAWIDGIAHGGGNSHGNWWNGSVWSECRHMAGQYFSELADRYPASSPRATVLAASYTTLGDLLHRVSDKALPAHEQTALLEKAKELETGCIPLLAELAEEIELTSGVDERLLES